MKQVVIYPAGFIGYDVGWPIIRTDPPVDTKNVLARFGADPKERLSISNRAIEQLFHLYHTRSTSVNDAQFISDCISAATNSFGTTSFYEWVQMQLQSPYLTSYHRDFLNETLAYIFYGEERHTLFTSWRGLLRPKEATPLDAKTLLRHQECLARYGKDSFAVTDVVLNWVNRKGGVQDLLYTLHLVFGEPPVTRSNKMSGSVGTAR